jgi:hypothetical protein
MGGREEAVKIRCRVWIVRYEGAAPSAWLDVPAGAVAIEPAEGRVMTARRARRYAEVFNRAALAGTQKVWAVALPMTIRYEGDARPGERLSPSHFSRRQTKWPAVVRNAD